MAEMSGLAEQSSECVLSPAEAKSVVYLRGAGLQGPGYYCLRPQQWLSRLGHCSCGLKIMVGESQDIHRQVRQLRCPVCLPSPLRQFAASVVEAVPGKDC